jgi:hypothetical protein
MGLPFQRFQKDDEYAYYPISDADDDESSDGYETNGARSLRGALNKSAPPAKRRETTYVEKATQTRCPRSPYPISPYYASTYSISSSLNGTTSRASRVFNIRIDSAVDLYTASQRPSTDTRTFSAIEMQPISPARRYPPGVVVIRTFDEHGVEIVEETDLTHRGTPYVDLKPTVMTREVDSGVVQKTARMGLMERALERVVDALKGEE